MPQLKATYKSESDIPDGLSDYYSEKADGTLKLQLDGDFKTQDDVDRAMKAMKKQKDRAIDLEKKLSEYPDDFDAERWNELKDFDIEDFASGDLDQESKEFQQAVSKAVREREKEIKQELENSYESKEQELEGKESQIRSSYKRNWLRQELAEKHGFSDPKKLRWMLLDIENGQYPDIKEKLDTLEVDFSNGQPSVVGGGLNDNQGAHDVIESVAQSDISKDYKPANDNSGGGAPPEGSNGSLPVGISSKADFKNDKEKIKFVSEHGLESWKNLPNE